MTTQQAYQWLIDNRVFWNRQDKTHIWVMTSGYKTHFETGHYGIEQVLMKAKMRMVSEEFDRHSGQTKAVYRHK